jgi:hypothetical protein
MSGRKNAQIGMILADLPQWRLEDALKKTAWLEQLE